MGGQVGRHPDRLVDASCTYVDSKDNLRRKINNSMTSVLLLRIRSGFIIWHPAKQAIHSKYM